MAAFAYEDAGRLTAKTGDVFMCCSDYPHSEGTASPILDYEKMRCTPDAEPGLFEDNIRFLLRT